MLWINEWMNEWSSETSIKEVQVYLDYIFNFFFLVMKESFSYNELLSQQVVNKSRKTWMGPHGKYSRSSSLGWTFSPSLFYSLVFFSPMAIPMAVTDWKEQAVLLNLRCSLVSISCLLVVLTGVLIPSSTNWAAWATQGRSAVLRAEHLPLFLDYHLWLEISGCPLFRNWNTEVRSSTSVYLITQNQKHAVLGFFG